MKSVPEIMARTARGKKTRHAGAPARILAQEAVNAILEKKGRDVVVMDMRTVSGVADLFVLCTGDSDLQIKAIVDSVRSGLRERCAEKAWHIEGENSRQWVLIDYVDLVVHVFAPEPRDFYDLERLWGDAPRAEIKDDASAADIPMLRADAPAPSSESAETEPDAPAADVKPAPRKRASRAKKPEAPSDPDPS